MNPRWKILAAGAALILLSNGVALTGVYLNRSGEPESRVQLSQRELSHPWGWHATRENSGLELRLDWRVVDVAREEYFAYYGSQGGMPEWLDEARLTELGIDVAAAKETRQAGRYRREAEREVLVVLELAGPAWQQMVERARKNLVRHEAALAANEDAKEFINRAKQARENLKREENVSSRLFAVDAGLDLAALRTKYPDRGRHMIFKAKLRPQLTTNDKKTVLGGYLGSLSVTQINVPHDMRAVIETAFKSPSRQRRLSGEEAMPFTVTLAVGRRLEPWIEAVAPGTQ